MRSRPQLSALASAIALKHDRAGKTIGMTPLITRRATADFRLKAFEVRAQVQAVFVGEHVPLYCGA